jgi:hypothetical protein
MRTCAQRTRCMAGPAVAASLVLTLALVFVALGPGAERAEAAKLTRGYATGTLYLNRLETKDVATAGPLAGAVLCGIVAYFTPPGGLACGAQASAYVVQAVRAENRGMCLKIKFSPPVAPFVVPTWPDIYRGGYCT